MVYFVKTNRIRESSQITFIQMSAVSVSTIHGKQRNVYYVVNEQQKAVSAVERPRAKKEISITKKTFFSLFLQKRC
jgi:hypothetical protein